MTSPQPTPTRPGSAADAALYDAKHAGRGTYRYYTEALTQAAQSRLQLDGRLRRAAGILLVAAALAACGIIHSVDPRGGIYMPGTLHGLPAAISAQFVGAYLALAALMVLFMLANMLLELPMTVWRTFGLEARFGFNRTTWPVFLADRAKGLLLGGLIGIPFLYAVIYLMGIGGAWWWLWVWALWLGFSLLMLWAFPKWIAPLFNKFEPLPEGRLKAQIEDLLARTGFQSKGIFVMDGSKRSGHGNAYFTGLGANKRIVFYDTLLKDMQPDEVEAVLAHELGHFKHRHIIKQMALTFALGLAVLFVLNLLMKSPAFYLGLGVHYPSHAMALLLFMLVLPVFAFPLSPLLSMLSRKNEFEADRFAAETASAQDLAAALTKLYRSNAASLVADKWYERFYASHPGAQARIAALKKAV